MSAIDLGQAVRDLLAPLRELQKTAQREEEEAQKTLDAARARRREIDKMLRAIDPEAEPFHKNGGKKGTTSKYSAERIDRIRVILQEHKEQLNSMNRGAGFYASDPELPNVADFGLSQASLSSLFAQCRDAGFVRLSKRGGVGGRKYYKVV